jgi:internalin A
MSEKALRRIAENKKTKDPKLDLTNCDLTTLPAELSACDWLTDLDIGLNEGITDLSPLAGLVNLLRLGCHNTLVANLSPLTGLTNLDELRCFCTPVADLSPLAGLVKLENLSCDETQVTDLSPLADLKNLASLGCSYTPITDLSPLAGLANLVQLNCSNTQVADLSPLAGLANLVQLNCSSTQVDNLLPLAGLANLRNLYCSDTPVPDLSPLAGLANLEMLDCANTQVADLSPLAGLTNLELLDCDNTQVADLSPLAGFANLKMLHCTNTQVVDLSPVAGLANLVQLSCDYTQVTDLSPIINLIRIGIAVSWIPYMKYTFLIDTLEKYISITNCPLIYPPVEIARDSPQAVRDYFEELGEDGCRLNEVKVIFLGEASAGKTSLVKRLMGEQFDQNETQTHGIRICKVPFMMADGDEVAAHLWDFGGQEVMYATHQFFLSERSVYVLLLNSRNDDQAEKWLKHAESFGGNSPVLVVLNKIDENPGFEVERKSLKEKYSQIAGFHRLSCAEADNKGFNDFREALRCQIDQATTRLTPFPKHWLAVKNHFCDLKQDFIESAEYRRICAEKGVERPLSQDVLLQFLHDLGVIINFRNLQYFDTQILNPLWLTNGVYRIINSTRLADNGGILKEADFDAVINDPRYQNHDIAEKPFDYPKNKLHYIVRVMQEFELCFRVDDTSYVIPQLLPANAPDFNADGAMLRFVIHFPDFMPSSIFPRLMVKLHSFIRGNERWRTGMVLHKPNVFKALARVRWDKEDQKLLLDVCGDERRRFLSFIRETVKEIVADFANLSFIELVPVPDCDDFQEYDYLVEAEKAGETDVFVKQLKKRIPIAILLDGVEESVMPDEQELIPVKAFVSYSHKDLDYLKELRTALAPLVRLSKLQIWDDRDIDAGDEWRKAIFEQLEQADIVLCLISADFVASDFCYEKEFGTALTAHNRDEKTIVPIQLRKTDWQGLPVAEIQGIPGEWISSAGNKDEAWTKVSELLRHAVEKAKVRKRAKMKKEKEL